MTQEGEAFVLKAVAMQGGLQATKVTLAEVGVRGDAALISAMLHEDEATRHYLSFTGAGHVPG